MEPAVAIPSNESKGSLARPKRPLSAFNLFYRFKRQHVTDALARGMEGREAIVELIHVSPGLECCSPGTAQDTPTDVIRGLRRYSIRKALAENLLPREAPDRAHRRDRNAMNGAMGFVELAGVMRESWKGCDEFAKDVFRELADEGRAVYRQRMKEWNDTTSRELVLRELAAKSSTKQARQSSSKRLSAKLSKKGRIDKKAPPRLAVKDSHHQDGGTIDNITKQPSSNEDPPTIKYSWPAWDGSHSRDGRGAANHTATAEREPSGFSLVQVSSGSRGGSPSDSRSASADSSPLQASEPSSRRGDEAEGRLQARVRELEAQLHAERLRARVRELEVELTRQRANGDLLTRRLEAFSGSRGATNGATGGTLPVQGGRWPLLSTLWGESKVGNILPAAQHSMMHYASDEPSDKKRRLR